MCMHVTYSISGCMDLLARPAEFHLGTVTKELPKPVLLNRRVPWFFPRTASLGCRAPEAAFHMEAAPPLSLLSAAATFSAARLEQLGVKCSSAAVSAVELPRPIFPGWPEKAWNGFACGGRTRGKVSLTVLLN